MKSALLLGAAAVASVITFSTAAFADSLYYYSGYTVSGEQSVSISGLPNGVATSPANGTFGAGQIVLQGANTPANSAPVVTSAGNNIAAWCIDAYDDLQGTGIYTVKSAAYVGGSSNFYDQGLVGNLISTQTLGEIGALVQYGTQNIGQSNVSAAIQEAIWRVEYNVGDGDNATFSINSTVDSLADSYITNVTQGTWTAVTSLQEVVGAGNQTLVSAVPLPGALSLFGAGLLGLGALGWRKVRRTAV
jgi:hypothetical protein